MLRNAATVPDTYSPCQLDGRAAEPGPATVARVEAGRLVITGAPERASQIHVSGTTVSDAGAMRPGTGCTRLSASRVQCAQIQKVAIYLGNRNDTVLYDSAVPTRAARR